jgi:hypothetical protein
MTIEVTGGNLPRFFGTAVIYNQDFKGRAQRLHDISP